MPIYKRLGFGRSNSLLKRRCCNASGPNLLSCADITNQEPQTEKRCFFLTCVQHHNTAKTPESCTHSAFLAVPKPVGGAGITPLEANKPFDNTVGAAQGGSWQRNMPHRQRSLQLSLKQPALVLISSSITRHLFDFLASVLLDTDLLWVCFVCFT